MRATDRRVTDGRRQCDPLVRSAVALLAALPLFQAASCSTEQLGAALRTEITQVVTNEVFFAAETILLNVLGA
ncbi:MAG: hypothetical protein IT449_11945 [Phycisphaerales bacterium]|nr:hypothetical protein [Phycisphaerales bacterium]